jgi:glycosyltransferase involved in cell wall biosynthesis
MNSSPPNVSIVIPIHNEEAILRAAIVDLRERLRDCNYDWELILVENGSTDNTTNVANGLAQKYPNISVLSLPEPNYGSALRQGIVAARGDIVICEEIDLCDTAFHQQALNLLADPTVDIVIGSKLLNGASDRRPLMRHAASYLYSTMLRIALGFRGTDTHGLKALRRSTVLPVVRACVIERDVFASELVLRAERTNLKIIEIPVRVMELRPPSINLFARVPRVLGNVFQLALALRKKS